jgi:hypothetical protein
VGFGERARTRAGQKDVRGDEVRAKGGEVWVCWEVHGLSMSSSDWR